jgi:hypothetical protein
MKEVYEKRKFPDEERDTDYLSYCPRTVSLLNT